MPAFLLDLLIRFALSFGIPWAVDWLFKKLPWLAKAIPNLAQILEDLIKSIKGAETRAGKTELKRMAKERIKRECFGVGCETDVKS